MVVCVVCVVCVLGTMGNKFRDVGIKFKIN
jgi:hypothetical protein